MKLLMRGMIFLTIYIDELFITNKSIHSRLTRHGGYNLVYPRHNRSSEVGKSLTISIKLWNSLPPEIKRKQSIASFKSALREHFMGTYANIDSLVKICKCKYSLVYIFSLYS